MAVWGLRKHLRYVMSVVRETGLASVSTPPLRLRRHNTPDSCFETLTAFLRLGRLANEEHFVEGGSVGQNSTGLSREMDLSLARDGPRPQTRCSFLLVLC